MKKTIMLIALSILSIVSITSVISFADKNARYEREYGSRDQWSDDEGSHDRDRGGWLTSRADVQPTQNQQYQDECGECHFAYQPGLLPQSYWDTIMATLDNHYGDDASLDEEQTIALSSYLLENSADRSSQSRSRAFALGSEATQDLPRITNTNYFRKEHHEIPIKWVKPNPDIGSFSNCQACHANAEAGIFNEHQVVIPGIDRWDD